MRKVLISGLAIVLTVCGAVALRAQDVSQADKDRALQYLESTKKGVEDATKGLSDAQWNFKPAPPTNRFGSPADAEKHFLESRLMTEEYLKATPDLRAHAIDSPMGVKLDGYEWILLIAAHSERHTKQMLEVKADPNFPKL